MSTSNEGQISAASSWSARGPWILRAGQQGSQGVRSFSSISPSSWTGKSPPEPKELESAYVAAAFEEARSVTPKGLLTVELPDAKTEEKLVIGHGREHHPSHAPEIRNRSYSRLSSQ